MTAIAPARPEGLTAVWRGFSCRCPRCGEGRLFGRFLKVAENCTSCELHLHHHRADDFPPYIVMFVVGHLVGFGIYYAETRFDDVPVIFHAFVWPSLAIGLSLALLQPVKGAVVGLQYALGMHGFGGTGGWPDSAEGVLERRAGGAADGIRDGRPPRAKLAEPEA